MKAEMASWIRKGYKLCFAIFKFTNRISAFSLKFKIDPKLSQATAVSAKQQHSDPENKSHCHSETNQLQAKFYSMTMNSSRFGGSFWGISLLDCVYIEAISNE